MWRFVAILYLLLALHISRPALAQNLDASNVWKVVSSLEKQRDCLTIDVVEKITGHDLEQLSGMNPPDPTDQFSAKSSVNSNEFANVEYRMGGSTVVVERLYLHINRKLKIPQSEISKRFGKPVYTQPTPFGKLSRFPRPWGAIQVGYAPNNGPVDSISLEIKKLKKAPKRAGAHK